ncbi:MAG: LCP family protein [Lachnospiraceae bacterium]|nr:LCP family protein [Lachnospiraceae bacterium]
MAGRKTGNEGGTIRSGAEKARARNKRKLILFVFELLVIVVMIVILYFVMRETEETEGPIYASTQDLTPADLGISEQVQERLREQGGAIQTSEDGSVTTSTKYLNLAFFGIDALSTKSSDLLSGYRSDSIMIASINTETGEVKLVSVYRDTYLNIGNNTYNKCNSAYAKGGAVQAVSMLNSNLDLDITNWVAVSYKALVTAINDLGGVYIDVDSAELEHINNYQISIAQAMKLNESSITPVSTTGYQLLNGLQAAAYCRIRYTAGDDYKRAERQREVVKAMTDQAKSRDFTTLSNTFTDVINYTYTSLDSDTILALLKNITKYTIVDENGIPQESMRTGAKLPAKGDCVIPKNLEQNVVWLHAFLFGEENYVPSSTVKSYSSKIASDASAYIGN